MPRLLPDGRCRVGLALLLSTGLLAVAAYFLCPVGSVLGSSSLPHLSRPQLSASTQADRLVFRPLPFPTPSSSKSTPEAELSPSVDAPTTSTAAADVAAPQSKLLGSAVACDGFTAASGGIGGLLIPVHSRIGSTAQLGLPSSDLLWEEAEVSCPGMQQPFTQPSFESICALHRSDASIPASSEWAVTAGPVSKPGFVHLCYGRTHDGAALLTLADAFAGTSQYGFVWNSSHALAMNPWYSARYAGDTGPKSATACGAQRMACYEELVWAHSVYDSSLGPHPLLEVAPILSHLLDVTPSHVPIVLALTPQLQEAYTALGLRSERFVAHDASVVYHARKMWWMRRPEEYTSTYWQSLRRRLFDPPLQPVPPPSPNHRPVVVYLHRPGGHRSITNGDELIAALRAALSASYELVIFDGSLSLTQAIELFSRAALIVGPHGGAFLNALFLPPLSSVVEVAWSETRTCMPFPPYYFLMSCGLRLFHHVHVAEQGRYDGVFTLNASRVVDSVQRALDGQWADRQAAAGSGSLGQRLMEARMAAREVGGLNSTVDE